MFRKFKTSYKDQRKRKHKTLVKMFKTNKICSNKCNNIA